MGIFGEWDDKFERRLRNVLRHIDQNPGISGSDLAHKTHSLKGWERLEILDELLRQKEIRQEVSKGKGRPTKRYWRISSVASQDAPGSTQALKTAEKPKQLRSMILDGEQWITPLDYIKKHGMITDDVQIVMR